MFWCVSIGAFAVSRVIVVVVAVVKDASHAIKILFRWLQFVWFFDLVHQDAGLRSSLVIVNIILLSLPRALRVLGPQGKMMKNDRARYSHVETSGLVRVLRYVNEVVTHFYLIFVQARTFIAQQE